MIRLSPLVLLLIGVAATSATAQTTLTPVEPKVSCALLRGFDPRIRETPTQITDACEAEVGGKPICVVKGYAVTLPGETSRDAAGLYVIIIEGHDI